MLNRSRSYWMYRIQWLIISLWNIQGACEESRCLSTATSHPVPYLDTSFSLKSKRTEFLLEGCQSGNFGCRCMWSIPDWIVCQEKLYLKQFVLVRDLLEFERVIGSGFGQSRGEVMFWEDVGEVIDVLVEQVQMAFGSGLQQFPLQFFKHWYLTAGVAILSHTYHVICTASIPTSVP